MGPSRSVLYLDFDNVFSGLLKLDPKLALRFVEEPQIWLDALAAGSQDESSRRWLGRVPQCVTRASLHSVLMRDRLDMSDERWALIKPHLPASSVGRAGRRWSDHRVVINAVLWRTRAGAAWRDLPAEYGPWKTAYNRHRRWAGDGTWQEMLAELQRGSDADAESFDVGIDSTVIRAHHHAAGAPHRPPSDVPAERLTVALDDYQSTRSRSASSPTGA